MFVLNIIFIFLFVRYFTVISMRSKRREKDV